MFAVRAFCLLFLVTVTFADGGEVERISGGQNARSGQFPFMASLRANNRHFCGAGIISNRFLLSSAFCVRGVRGMPSRLFAVVGAYGRTDGVTHPTDRVISHPNFYTRHNRNNIAVIRTARVIQFNNVVRALTFPTTDSNKIAPALFAGWGLLRITGSDNRAKLLQWKQTETLPREMCRQRFRRSAIYVDPKSVCTNNRDGVGGCTGDAGGPLFTKDGVILGVAAVTMRCTGGQPDIFTRVFPHLAFIRAAVRAP